jgi:hypothetical protein
MVVSSPMPTARTSTRRRQYVAREIVAGRGRAPRGGPASARRFWSIPVTMEDSRRMSSKARRKKASSASAPHGLAYGPRETIGRPVIRRARVHLPTAPARAATAAGAFIPRPSIQPAGIRLPGGAAPLRAQFGW